jgi:hypothetical protein
MAKNNSKPSVKNTRDPHEVISLLHALHHAGGNLLDGGLTLALPDEMYAVFEERSAVSAFAFLFVRLAGRASLEELTAEERARRIYIRISGKCRIKGQMLTESDLVPEREEDKALFDRLLARNRMAYVLKEKDGAFSLTVSLPRFLADDHDAFAVNANEAYDSFYDVMLHLAGKAPKHPLDF